MKKFFTKMALMVALVLGVAALNAQIIWPTADTNTIRMSQFADASTIRYVKKDTALSASLDNYKGWITVGVFCDVPAKSDSAVWLFASDGSSRIGAFGGTLPITPLDTSRGRGAAIFSSDYLDNRGAQNNFGNGPAPANNTGQRGELWSPIIDATGINNLSVLFQSFYRHFSSTNNLTNPFWASSMMSWSEDGGVTWKEPVAIDENDGYALNEQTPTNVPTVIKFPGSKGTNKFRFKFIFEGNYYFWLVDDVRLGVVKNNMRINTTTAAIPPIRVGRGNVDSVRFLATVVNNGAALAKNVKLTAKVFNSTSQAEVFSTVSNLGDIQVDTAVKNKLLPLAFLPPATIGSYDIVYRISYDSLDEYRRDDTLRFNTALTVTDSAFRHDQLATAAQTLTESPNTNWGTTIKAWRVGQYYFMPKGASSTATSITAIIYDPAITAAGRFYTVGLYEWNDANSDGIVQTAERTLIATGEKAVGIDAADRTVRGVATVFYLDNFVVSNKPVYLKNNTAYLAMLDLTPTNAASAAWVATFEERGRFSAIGMKTASRLAGQPRYAGVINGNSNDDALPWSTRVFGDDVDRYSPKIRLTAWPVRIDTKDNLPETYKINIYPNPVGQNLNINLDFPKSEEAVLFRIFDLKGQLIQEREMPNIQKTTVNMDVNKLASGNYLLQVQTLGNQAKTLKFVKAN